jgi:hypothetical protein
MCDGRAVLFSARATEDIHSRHSFKEGIKMKELDFKEKLLMCIIGLLIALALMLFGSYLNIMEALS